LTTAVLRIRNELTEGQANCKQMATVSATEQPALMRLNAQAGVEQLAVKVNLQIMNGLQGKGESPLQRKATLHLNILCCSGTYLYVSESVTGPVLAK